MKSTIRIDVDNNDVPVIAIRCVVSSFDLRDKTLQSFLRKLGFEHAKHDQVANLQIRYTGWGGGGDSYEEYEIVPEKNSVVTIINTTTG